MGVPRGRPPDEALDRVPDDKVAKAPIRFVPMPGKGVSEFLFDPEQQPLPRRRNLDAAGSAGPHHQRQETVRRTQQLEVQAELRKVPHQRFRRPVEEFRFAGEPGVDPREPALTLSTPGKKPLHPGEVVADAERVAPLPPQRFGARPLVALGDGDPLPRQSLGEVVAFRSLRPAESSQGQEARPQEVPSPTPH